jgi:hypothetical protein
MAILQNLSAFDTALKTKLEGLIIAGTSVPVIYMNPEEGFQVETFPSIVYYRSGDVKAPKRICTDDYRDNPIYDDNENLIEFDVRPAPIAKDVLYIIRTYYNYAEDGPVLDAFIMKNLPPAPYPCFVEVNGEKYDLFLTNHYIPSSWTETFGEKKLKQENREFFEQYMYWAEINLDLFEGETVKTVQEFIPIVHTK